MGKLSNHYTSLASLFQDKILFFLARGDMLLVSMPTKTLSIF